MPRKPPQNDGPTTPGEYPQTPPVRNLYETSDIRFVTLEIGKLVTKVDRLINDVDKHGAKIEAMEKEIVAARTWIKAGLLAITLIAAGVGFYLSERWDKAIDRLQSTVSAPLQSDKN